MRRAAAVLGVMLACSAGCAVAAERIVPSLATHQVFITSNFSGLDLVLFGSVERDANTPVRKGPYDLVVTVTGPREKVVTRKKERVLGIWVNVESRPFIDVPSYLAVLSTRPIDGIADIETLRRLQVGLRRTVLPQQIGNDVADVVRDDPFRVAFLDIKQAHHLYVEQPSAITFLTPTLFRATIPLPAEVPIGNYDVDIKLFADGAMVARASSAFEIIKSGFERFVANAATSHGILYGLAAAAMALLTGWLASVVFRRD